MTDIKMTTLMLASYHQDENLVEKLIEAGANVNATNKSGFTLLNASCRPPLYKPMDVLIKSGSDVNTACNLKYTPLISIMRVHHAFFDGFKREDN